MTKVLASEFSDSTGCYNDNKLDDGGYYYAELSTNPDAKFKDLDYSALGNLEKFHKLKITYKGKSCIAKKGDRGRGKKETSGPFKGELRKIDLHKTLARALDFNGLDHVTYEDYEDA